MYLGVVSDTTKIQSHLEKRLKAIQGRHNFNPRVGSRQVREHPELRQEFGAFQELLKLLEVLDLDIAIPYDPAGLDIRKTTKVEAKPVYVYFMREQGDPIWKIGYSSNLYQRKGGVQTGNSNYVGIVHKIACKDVEEARSREKQLHRYFEKLKTRHHNSSVKGEWYRIRPSEVTATVKRLKTEGWDWLKAGRPS